MEGLCGVLLPAVKRRTENSPYRNPPPLHERHLCVVFPHHLDLVPDLDVLFGIAEEVAHHTHVAGVGQLDQDDEVRHPIPEGGVHGVPYPLEGVDLTASGALAPTDLLGTTTMADPLRAELKSSAGFTALHQESVLARPLPKGGIESVRHRRGQRRTGR